MFVKMESPQVLLATCCLIVVIQCIQGAPSKPPVWVKNCPQSGPLSLNDCIVKRIRFAMPYVVPGYPKYRLPALDPLEVTSIEVDTGSKQIGLSLKLAKVKIHGLHTADFYKSSIDLASRHWELYFTNPRLEVLGDYKMDGKVLILPITGEGLGNITLSDISGHYTMDWEYYKKNNKQYAHITSSTMGFKVGRAYFNYQNLFNGDKALGAQMNNFLNENWAEVIQEFGPAVGDAFNQVFRQLIQNGFDLVPFDSFFPE